MGRPPKHEKWLTEEGLERLEGWAFDGLTDEQIAVKMGISVSTLYSWKRKHPQIAEAIHKGKAPVDIKVERALYETAVGYTRTVKKPFKVRREIGKAGGPKKVEEVIEYAEEEIYVPGNPLAQKFWLMARKPEQWNGDRREIDLTLNPAEGEAVISEIRQRMAATQAVKPPEEA